ncbi:outer membrane protein assembly factor BamE [Nitratireductor indicus]|uniref:outer membrane protein assembly factor BamE n=1 Tax=Nitratireductor indicus TaxID=721133 RepID=UPI00287697D6|nr:outer membrane protein assembly factor BamE [Nitratireductor indicus]MDS1134814.1 outer membrane protein assembly factor BamE [Nitratireductor indicus]
MEMSLQVIKINSNPVGRLVLAAGLAGAAAVLSGCNAAHTLDASETLTQGYVIDEQAIELVPVGSSREQVTLALGTPSTTATFDNEAFYYISQKRVRSAAFMRPRLVDQRILAVYFGPDERVSKIANYGLKDGKVFDFISSATPTGGKEQTFIGQILAGASKGGPPSGMFGGGG